MKRGHFLPNEPGIASGILNFDSLTGNEED